MFLSKRPNGIYYLYFQDNSGKRQKISTRSSNKSDALGFLVNFKRDLREGRLKKPPPLTLTRLRLEIQKHSETLNTWKTTCDYGTTFNALIKHFGDLPVGELTRAMLEEYVLERIRKTSVYAGRKDIAYMSAAFNFAVNRGYLAKNPCNGIKKPKIPEKLPLFFSREEMTQLLSAVNEQDIADIIVFAVNTGIRQGELLELRWDQIDLSRRRLTLSNRVHLTKSKKVRTVPLNEAAVAVLENRKRRAPGDHVFTFSGRPMSQNFVVKRFKKYVKAAHLNPAFHFHSLRHTFASWLVMKGVSLYEVQRLLGHSSPAVTQIYAHLSTDTLSNAVDKLMDPSK